MNNEFVPYEQAVELKELGFDEKCYRGYDKNQMLFYSEQENGHELNYSVGMNVSAPLKQQVFRWFRQKYEVYPTIMTETEDDSLYFRFIAEGGPEWLSFSKIYYTYEEAELACLKKLIEIVKSK